MTFYYKNNIFYLVYILCYLLSGIIAFTGIIPFRLFFVTIPIFGLLIFEIINKEKIIYDKSPEKLTPFLIKAFIGKMLVYGLYIIIIFSFYSFNPIPFIISFSASLREHAPVLAIYLAILILNFFSNLRLNRNL